MRIAIVDDEAYWRTKTEETICSLFAELDWKEEIKIESFSGGEAFCEQSGYEVVFLDVEMGGMDGFDTARRYIEKDDETVIIFLTTHTELSRRGYQVNAFRYIDKDAFYDEIKEAIGSLKKLRSKNQQVTLHILQMGEMSFAIKDIYFIETERHNVLIHTKDAVYRSNQKMDEIEKELEKHGFFRSHKSYLVNVANIQRFDKEGIYFKNGEKAMISVRKYPELKKEYINYRFEIGNG